MKIQSFLKKEGDVIGRDIYSLLSFKLFFRFRYPKLVLFVLCIVVAYFVFTDSFLSYALGHLGGASYYGVFVAGIMFSFGFSSPFSAALLLLMNPDNLILASLVGGVGCLIGDLLIFKFVKVSFKREFENLRKEAPFRFVKERFDKLLNPKIEYYLLFAFAAFFFASPFIPDEAAVLLLAAISNIDVKKLAIISFVCNTIGIFILLAL